MTEVTSPKLAWTLILVSGLLEIAFAAAVHHSAGFTRAGPAVLALLFGGLSVYLMSLALGVVPIGTAYAVWAGIGAAGTALLGIAVFGESTSPARILCLGLVIVGIVGLQLLEPGKHAG